VRTFDVTGALAVAFWLVFTGLYVYRHQVGTGPSQARSLDAGVPLREGDTWMILQRDNDDIGFVHRTRTRLDDGWLTEYEMLLAVELLGQKRPVDVSIKARLDGEAYLTSFDAEVRAGGRKVTAQGDVHADTVSLLVNPESDPIERDLPLDDRPRLATHSIHQLLGRDELHPGDRFRNTYFDPTSLGMQQIVMEYVGRESVEVFGESHESHHLTQTVSGETYDVYVDPGGELLIREFPFDIVGVRVRPELGRARAADIRERADAAENADPGDAGRLGGAGLEAAFEMLGVSPESLGDGSDSPLPAVPAPDASPSDGSSPSAD